ncbi:enoyl-CoA hydratase/isomerase family protein [Desulfobacterium sp. N47]|uniref:Enoyl-CoA hydratase/isomerase domain-containing protein n=1 Tax=uncultured Desulfobacterium sp. TaxID=201089 RepID=E1YHX7_9BACT|nr:unknown protein [uncultured Desulfobacterium sp.]
MHQNNDSHTPVMVKKHKHMLTIVLNRPEALNSLNHKMISLIRMAIDEAKEDNSVRTLLIDKDDKPRCQPENIEQVVNIDFLNLY